MHRISPQTVKIFENTIKRIADAETVKKAEDIAQLTRGWLVGIRLMGILNNCQYDSMSDLVEFAVEAARKHIENATPGVTSTESGKEREYTYIPTISISVFCVPVKRGGELD